MLTIKTLLHRFICRIYAITYRLRFGLFLSCLAVLFWGILRPESPPYLFHNSDKYLHFLAFLSFALITRFAFCKQPSWGVWGFLFLCAPSLELLQHWVQPSRTFSLADAAANLIGVSVAFILWQIWKIAGNKQNGH